MTKTERDLQTITKYVINKNTMKFDKIISKHQTPNKKTKSVKKCKYSKILKLNGIFQYFQNILQSMRF